MVWGAAGGLMCVTVTVVGAAPAQKKNGVYPNSFHELCLMVNPPAPHPQ